MTRVVADTNIFISALLFGGLPGAFSTWRCCAFSCSQSRLRCSMSWTKSSA